MAPDMTSRDQPDKPPDPRTSPPENESGDVGFAIPSKLRPDGMVNVEITDDAGTRRALMVRFPRTQVALGSGLVTVLLLGLPWLIVPLMGNDTGLPDWSVSLAVVLVLGIAFGWILVPLLLAAVRGGYLALMPAGVLIQNGLNSVLIPWAAIQSVAADTTAMAAVFTSPDPHQKARYPVMRLKLRSGRSVPGWPWPAALSSALLGSSRRTVQIPAWWLQPVPLNWLVALVSYLMSHPEERKRIGNTDPERWDLLLAQE